MENGNKNKESKENTQKETTRLGYTDRQLIEIMEELISMYDIATSFTPLNNNKTKE